MRRQKRRRPHPRRQQRDQQEQRLGVGLAPQQLDRLHLHVARRGVQVLDDEDVDVVVDGGRAEEVRWLDGCAFEGVGGADLGEGEGRRGVCGADYEGGAREEGGQEGEVHLMVVIETFLGGLD